ncbi:hypothetical protein [Shouchella miscanthi]|uniref:hypothetical protein n=1 Tax=Shouchella miscanthi TaxID=2598861 RepID=UPI0011A69411|nr:hypothetical protein [Shouchella miscanthi]
MDDFEDLYGDYELDESQSFPTAYFLSNNLNVAFADYDEEYRARTIRGEITSLESLEEALNEINERFVPKEYEYKGPNCNNQMVAELYGEKTDTPRFYFADEDQLGIEVTINTKGGNILERVSVEEVGSVGERRYDCEVDVDESIKVGNI